MGGSEGGVATPVPVQNWVRQADETVAAQVEDLHRLEAAAQAGWDVELARRVARMGPGSPVTAAMAQRIEVGGYRLAEIAADVERIRTPVPAPDSRVAIVYGRVLDAGLAGMEGVRVVAVDPAGKALSSATTGGRGHFELTIGSSEGGAVRPPAGSVPVARLVARRARGPALAEERDAVPRPPGTVTYAELVAR